MNTHYLWNLECRWAKSAHWTKSTLCFDSEDRAREVWDQWAKNYPRNQYRLRRYAAVPLTAARPRKRARSTDRSRR